METFTTYLKRMMTGTQNLRAQGFRGAMFTWRKVKDPLISRLTWFLDESYRDGMIGHGRYSVLQGKARKLQRFLTIKGLSAITPREFSTDLLLEYRQFIYDEYLYVSRFPQLYPKGGGRHAPRQRCKDTTAVHDLKALQACFRELECATRDEFVKINGEPLNNCNCRAFGRLYSQNRYTFVKL